MRVRVDDIRNFIEDHNLSRLCQTEDEMVAITDAFIAGEDSVEMPDNYWAVLVKRDAEYSEISLHRVAGMEREADGDVDAAINEYAESIRLGEVAENEMYHAYAHSYSRIIVLLGKVHRFAEEIDYIESVLKHSLSDSERARYTERLEKAKVKLEKQSKNGRI